ncbi:MAG: hypothetical protein JO208_13030 [Alphaproteobacteria bacterium]|nr:hypothetical protein [Alphaproteobacteria bacterium]
MGSRGRQSADAQATLAVIEVRRPPPPADLSEAEALIWKDVVSSMPADWFRRAHAPVLAAYCRHTARAALLAQQVNAFKPEWLKEPGGLERFDKMLAMAERETRALTACARSMRLTHQAQIRATGAGTAVGRSSDTPRPWDYGQNGKRG